MTVETGLRTLSDAEQPATPSEHLYDERLRSPDPDVLVEPGTPRSHPRSTSRRSAQNLSRFDSTFRTESLLRAADTAADGVDVSDLLACAQVHALLACAARLTDLVGAVEPIRVTLRQIRGR